MPDPAAILSYPSARQGPSMPVFHTVRATLGGPIISLKASGQMGANGVGTASFEVFSGKDDPLSGRALTASQSKGTIPKGTWFIARRRSQYLPAESARRMVTKRVLSLAGEARYHAVTAKPLWLALYRDDRGSGDKIDDYTYEGTVRRSGIRIHFGRVSWGCLTFRYEKDYVQMLRLLSKTQPRYINSMGEPVTKDTKGRIEVHGKLVVGE